MTEKNRTEQQPMIGLGADLTITHTHAEGTLIDGTVKDDGTADILKVCRWRYSRALEAWYLPRSRDTAAKHHQIMHTVGMLQQAGFAVEVEIDDEPRDPGQVEADRAARSQARANALTAKAQRQDAQADRYRAASDRHTARFAGGQPILTDHHSAPAAIRAQQKGHAAMRRAIDTQQQADETQRRADAAAAASGARYNPVTVANRIARLEADARRLTRQIDGHTRTAYITAAGEKVTETTDPATGQHAEKLWTRREEIDAQIAYWQGIRDAQIERGEATNHSREGIAVGDAVKISGHWYRVTRANAKTVTVHTEYGTQKAPYAKIQDHKPTG